MEKSNKRNAKKRPTKSSVIKLSKKKSVEGSTRTNRKNNPRDKKKAEKKKEKQVVLETSLKEGEGLNEKLASVGEDFSDKYEMILEKLAAIQDKSEARERLSQEIKDGNVEESDALVIMQKWRQRKRRKAYEEREEKVINMEGTLEDVKRIVHDLVRNRKLKKRDAGDIIRRWKNTERRRVKRQITKQTNRACFNCRQFGHVLADCPNRGDCEQTVGNISSNCCDGICFKCGSTEHNVRACPRKHVKGFPFATCFVCGQEGHLSRDCEKNPKGIYPDGGCCNVCGSTKHLKRDCPELAAHKQKKDHRNVTVRTMSVMSSADEDYVPEDETSIKEMEKRPKKKLVKF
ncbi:hypothetical protein KIN20_000740 [Parelaphostrongylus tenuis]|uniref:CCHC-type domain-containing protein n=1 Tax=Parelaphostrongylus tenuis TaxID=148309 RepID=A0AAD5QE31_PARTN|nr:hypothetical protein KIN20_000740 [Parelaphostrongylus tenuis]